MRALIADKHDLFRQSLTYVLNEVTTETIDVHETNDVDQFKRLARNNKYDLIVIGDNLTTDKLQKVVSTVHETQSRTPVLFVTDNMTNHLVQHLKALKLTGVIGKAASKTDYMTAFNKLLLGQSYFPKNWQADCAPKFIHNHQLTTPLTRRQEEVLFLLAKGMSNQEIAENLHLSKGTVKVHITAIFRILNVKNRTQAMLLAQQLVAN
jgi:DNA-binding NarL/FixJ family response regulator